jgi:hypothetical protein
VTKIVKTVILLVTFSSKEELNIFYLSHNHRPATAFSKLTTRISFFKNVQLCQIDPWSPKLPNSITIKVDLDANH